MSSGYVVFLKVVGVVCLAFVGLGVLIGRFLFDGEVNEMPLIVEFFFGSLLLLGLVYGVATVYFYIERKQKENKLIGADSRGLLNLNIDKMANGEYDQLAAMTLMAFHQKELEFAKQSGQVPVTYHDKRTIHYEQGDDVPQIVANEVKQLPGMTHLSDILPSNGVHLDSITLAVGLDGQPIRIPAYRLMHTSLLGRTGDGKSICLRGLLGQLLASGAKCLVADPHFTEFDKVKNEDWRPIAQRLYMPAAYDIEDIQELVNWFVEEMENRLELRRQGKTWGEPYFLAIDEFPSIVADWKEATDTLARILREGRKVGCYLITSSQSLLVKDTGGSTSIRDQYRTCAYMGGDKNSAKALLGVKESELGEILDGEDVGEGIAVLRCPQTRYPAKVRIPLTRNEDLYHLLPTSVPTSQPVLLTAENGTNEGASEGITKGVHTGVSSPREEKIRKMLSQGIAQQKIIQEIWGCTGGKKYQQASREISQIIAKIILTGGE